MQDRSPDYIKHLFRKKKWMIEEKEWMLDYLESHELSDLEAIAAEEFYHEIDSKMRVADARLSEDVLNKIHQRIKVPRPSLRQVVRMHWIRISVAACCVLVAGIGYMVAIKSRDRFNSMHVQHVFTAANERKAVRLPDGSLVSMEPESVLDYPEKFNAEKREVHLKGEAFFEVTKDVAHPFIIHTEHISTTVLGTSFNVEAYPSKEPRIVVVSGRVKVQTESREKQMIVLNPNQCVVYHKSTDDLQKEEARYEAQFYRQRRVGRFLYKAVALENVINDLQRFYKTSIVIDSNVKNCSFYGDFLTNDTIEKALSLIANSLNATVQKDNSGNGYLIVGGSCR